MKLLNLQKKKKKKNFILIRNKNMFGSSFWMYGISIWKEPLKSVLDKIVTVFARVANLRNLKTHYFWKKISEK